MQSKILNKIHWSVPYLLLSVLTAVFTLLSLNQTDFANGWDSYFYLIQIKSWVEEGAMHSSDLSLIYPLMLLMYKIIGSYVLSYKVTAALIAGCVALLTGLTARKWTKSTAFGLVLIGLILWSPHLSYIAAQYPKNLLGVLLFLCLLYVGEVKKWPILLGLLLVNFFGHRMTAVLSLLYIVVLFLLEFKYAKQLFMIVAAFAFLFVISMYIPGILSPLDFERFSSILSPTLQYPYSAFVQSFGAQNIQGQWHVELFSYTILYIVSLCSIPFIKKKESQKSTIALLLTLAILVAPIFKWTIDGAALRFYLIFILLAPLCLTLWWSPTMTKWTERACWIFIPFLLLLKGLSPVGYDPDKHDPDYAKYDKLTKRSLQYVPADSIELIIGHKSLAEYFTFTTWIDVLPWEVEYEVAPEKLWRIATDIELQTLYYYSDEEDHEKILRIGVNYFFLPDHIWKQVLKGAEEEGDEELLERVKSWRNPHIIRPAYLLKNKK